MLTRKRLIPSLGRQAPLVAVAGLVLAFSGSPSGAAETASVSRPLAANSASSDVTDFSAARRHRYYRRGPSAAGMAFMGMALGLVGTAIAEQRRREYYDRYYYAPGPYYGPAYGGPYYAPRYYYRPY